MTRLVRPRHPSARRLIPFLAICGLATSTALAQTTFYVNGTCGNDSWTGHSPECEPPGGPLRTINTAILAATHGDTIIVADGIYSGQGNVGLNLGSRRIVLRSENGPESCIIDGSGTHRPFWFTGFLTPETVIDGFTIQNGSATEGGAFFFHHTPSLTVRNCIIRNNTATRGGAIYLRIDGAPIFENCTFIGNTATDGGAVYATDLSAPSFINCLFVENTALNTGGGLLVAARGPINIVNSTFTENVAEHGTAFAVPFGTVALHNSVLWHNLSPTNAQAVVGTASAAASANLTISHSIVQGGQNPGILVEPTGNLGWQNGNLDLDPLFVDPETGNYRLAPGSPAIDAADNTAIPPHILTDLDGNARFVKDPATPNTGVPGGSGGAAIADIGAYEFQPCYANCDGSTTEPILTVDDFTCFINAFAEAQSLPTQQQIAHYANCDGSTTEPILTVDDFTCFINAFAQGCP